MTTASAHGAVNPGTVRVCVNFVIPVTFKYGLIGEEMPHLKTMVNRGAE